MSNEEKYKMALELALLRLIRFEPGDSRAVSDQFVAMAAILSDANTADDCVEIVRNGIRSKTMSEQNSAHSKPVPLDCALGAQQEEKIRCCPQCNYAKTKLEIEQSRYNYPCPNCDKARISDYYTLGSKNHQDILDGAALQMAPIHKWIPPLPMPKKSP